MRGVVEEITSRSTKRRIRDVIPDPFPDPVRGRAQEVRVPDRTSLTTRIVTEPVAFGVRPGPIKKPDDLHLRNVTRSTGLFLASAEPRASHLLSSWGSPLLGPSLSATSIGFRARCSDPAGRSGPDSISTG